MIDELVEMFKQLNRWRVHLGWWTVYIEPRDLWVGVYVAPTAVYVCLIPMLVIRRQRAVSVDQL